MVEKIKQKIATNRLTHVNVRQMSFDQLETLRGQHFDHIFSNFGGLNCIPELNQITNHLTDLLKPGGFITWVVMPPFCPWELLWVIKGHARKAFRRWKKNGAMAHVEGEYFRTYYHSLSSIVKSLGPAFQLAKVESLGLLTPPPASASFIDRFPSTFSILQSLERNLTRTFPFSRWGDHIIVTCQYKPLP